MRTRVLDLQKSEPGFTVKTYETFDSQIQKWVPAETVMYQFYTGTAGKLSTIVDVEPQKGRKRPYVQVNPVTHTILDYPRVSSERFGPVYETPTRRYMHGYAGFSNQAAHPYFAARRPNWWVTTNLPHKEAADHFNAGGVGTEVLLPNFLIELPSIKSTFSFIRQGLMKGKGVVDKTALIASGGFLSYNYGIAPLVADLKAIGGYVESLQKRLEWLLANDGQTVSLDFRKTLFTPPAIVDVTASDYWSVAEYSQTYHAFCRWTVKYDPVRSAWEKLKYFNRYFGTTRLLAVAWESLPLSFLLDYVTNVGDLLTQFELPTSLDPSCEGVGWSQKETMLLDMRYKPPSGSHTSTGCVLTKRYVRSPGLPLSLSTAVDLSSPTGKQQALFYSLIHQKR